MRASGARGGRRCNDSARMLASVPWNASGNESGAGESGRAGDRVFLGNGLVRGSRERQGLSLRY
jgi:hypothetical protein